MFRWPKSKCLPKKLHPCEHKRLPKMPRHQEWKTLLTAHLARSIGHMCFLFGASDFPPGWRRAAGAQLCPSMGRDKRRSEFKSGARGQLFILAWRWGRVSVLFWCFISSAGLGADSSLIYASSVLMLLHWILIFMKVRVPELCSL